MSETLESNAGFVILELGRTCN